MAKLHHVMLTPRENSSHRDTYTYKSLFCISIFSLLLPTLMGHSTFQRRIKMRKGQQQIRCSSGVSIAGRIDRRLQVIRLFIPVLSSPIPNPLSLTKSLHVILHSSSHGRLKLCPNPNRGVFFPSVAYS